MQTMKSTCGLRSAGGIKKLLWSTLLSLLVISISSAQDQDLNVLSTQGKTWLRFSNAHHALNLHLADEADKLLMRREQQVAQLNSLDEVEGRQREVKSILNELIGSTEKDTPLNATITGTVKKDGFNELQDWISYFDKFSLSKVKKLESLLKEKDQHIKTK